MLFFGVGEWVIFAGMENILHKIKMFKNTNEFKQIKEELQKINALEKVAIFECYGDGVVAFGLTHESVYHQFCIITKDWFLREMKIHDLLQLSCITFFRYSVFLNSQLNEDEQISCISWSIFGTDAN